MGVAFPVMDGRGVLQANAGPALSKAGLQSGGRFLRHLPFDHLWLGEAASGRALACQGWEVVQPPVLHHGQAWKDPLAGVFSSSSVWVWCSMPEL